MKRFFDFQHFRYDLLGGITAGIVALPLALAFGEQSGLGAAAGLYGAAFIAFFAALFGGTPTQISGPTAPMTALSMLVVAGLLEAFEGQIEHALPIILMVFFLAGLIQIGLGFLKLGTFIKFIPYTVVSGFMTGIGVIILITQIPPALGYYAGEDEAVIESFMPHAEELILDRILKEEAEDGILVLEDFKETILRAVDVTAQDIRDEAIMLATNDGRGVFGSIRHIRKALSNIGLIELILCLSTIAIIYLFPKITRVIPSTLVALVAVAGTAYFLELDYVLIQEIPMGLPKFHYDVFMGVNIGILAPFLISAFLLAMLGAIDSLLTSVVADNLTKTYHDPNKELVGQGIGNSIASLFGGLPGAGATIRTVVNIQAGGKTKLSGMVAGVLLFIILIVLGPIASKIPAAVLAGILITVGIGVMDYKGLKALPKMAPSEKVTLLIVLALTVFWQLVYAVAVGLVMAAVVFLKRMSDISADQVQITNLNKSEGQEVGLWADEMQVLPAIREKVIFKHLNGPMFFGITTHFRKLVYEMSDIHLLVIRMEKVPFVDQSGLYALESAIQELHDREVIVALSGPNKHALDLMRDMQVIPKIVSERHVFSNFDECRLWLREVLTTEGGLENEMKTVHRLKG
ncbi:MAG: SulP family inorganic anion transporter [Flavobacteriales bacterium]|nr:SulP family inorganic anion transporter [Flavobacteriales bacterium]MBT6131791.1 SulP family inorganic anion transporter [Flavobacteriales bacterium]